MKGYRIKIIRHGKTHANFNSSYIGLTDFPLCSQGIRELKEKKEKYDYGNVQKVYTSPLLRCKQTADIFFPDSLCVNVNEMREMCFGQFEGKTTAELQNDKKYIEWLKGGLDNAPPSGESIREVIGRSFQGFSYIIKDMMSEGFTNCALVTHGGIIMNSLACFGLPKDKPGQFTTDFGEGFELFITASMWQRANAFEIQGRYPYTKEEEQYVDFDDSEDSYYDDMKK